LATHPVFGSTTLQTSLSWFETQRSPVGMQAIVRSSCYAIIMLAQQACSGALQDRYDYLLWQLQACMHDYNVSLIIGLKL
jgi:hypothetical protein